MRVAHMADLHLGKKLKGFSLLEDQYHCIGKVLKVLKDEKIEILLLCGDIFDQSVASGDAMDLFDVFLTELSLLGITVLIISGNHDHPQRLSFASRLLASHNIYIHTDTSENFKPLEVKRKDVSFFLIPFFRPLQIQKVVGENLSYSQGWEKILQDIPRRDKRILLAHQFVTHQQLALESDSEILSVGTLENMEASLFDAFDYVALGHLHRPQYVKREQVRYCGSPLKFSLSESQDTKSLTLLDTDKMKITRVTLTPLRDVRKVQGPLKNLLRKEFASEDYVHAVLSDQVAPLDALSDLREVYPNLISLEYSVGRKRKEHQPSVSKSKDPIDMAVDFYQLQLEKTMDDESMDILEKVIKETL